MTAKPAEYYQQWADRLRDATGNDFTPDDVMEFERLSGKPIGEMSRADFDNVSMMANAAAVAAEVDADQLSADAQLFRAAMTGRGARTMGDLFEMLKPSDDDFFELVGALARLSTRLHLEADH